MKILAIIFLCAATICAQEKVKIEKPAAGYDIHFVIPADCENETGNCVAESFEITKHGSEKTFQVVKLDIAGGSILGGSGELVYMEDYNFDGIADLAVRDGSNGGYGGPSYHIYLFSPKLKKFVHNQAMTDLNQEVYLGVMKADPRRKVLQAGWKSGCCYHQDEEYKVVNNIPKKVLEVIEEPSKRSNTMKVTTTRLVKNKWRTTVKYVRVTDN